MKGKLILAELRDWALKLPQEEAIIGFRQMVTSLLSSHQEKEAAEQAFMTTLFAEVAFLNAMAQNAIEKQTKIHERMNDVQVQLETLALMNSIVLNLYLYEFNKEWLELWSEKISGKKKQDKEF